MEAIIEEKDESCETILMQNKINENGYIKVLTDNGWMLEHKYIVEKYIGRELKENEVIHHINENKKDNRIQNLWLFDSQNEHASFHNKIKQFGWTNPVKYRYFHRWDKYK